MQTIILASQSPRRRDALNLLGLEFTCAESEAGEMLPNGMLPQQGVRLLAKRKAQAAAKAHPNAICIGADTMVVHGGQILGKPRNKEEAFRMLSLLQNDRHDVFTGLCVCREGTAQCFCDFVHTVVRFLPMSPDDIRSYIQTGEPMDKAGGYGIQGRAAMYIHGIVGSYDSVVGLPLALLRQMLWQMGVAV